MDVFIPTIARLASIPLLLYGLYRLAGEGVDPRAKIPLVLLAAIVALPLAQLIPLPPSVWTSLPGHGFVASDDQAIGVPLTWAPISLTPDATWNAVLSLLPPAAVFLLALRCDAAGRRLLLVGLVAFALANVVLGAMQVAGGPDSPLRFYVISSRMEADGVFANRDHLAALLLVSLPICAWWMTDARATAGLPRVAKVVLGFSAIFVLVVGMAFTRSRAALVLGIVAAVASVALAATAERRTVSSGRRDGKAGASWWMWLAIGGVVIAMLAVVAVASQGTVGRFGGESLTARWARTPMFVSLGAHYFPFGSGLGSFDPVWRMVEPRALIDYAYLNHAHDEYAEIWITAGLVGVVLTLAAAGWIAWRSAAAWLGRIPGADGEGATSMARLGGVIVLLLMLHSIGDYPLRTSTLACVLALACALLVPPPSAIAGPQPARGRRDSYKTSTSDGDPIARFLSRIPRARN